MDLIRPRNDMQPGAMRLVLIVYRMNELQPVRVP